MSDSVDNRKAVSQSIMCGRTMEAGWLAAAVLIPLVMNPWGWSPFALPKAVFLQALVLPMVLCSLGGLVWQRPVPLAPPVRLMLWAAGLFVLVLLLASVHSVNPRLSLMGSMERQQGLPVQLAAVFLFFAVALWLRSEAQARRLVSALVWGSAPIVGYGLAQALSADPFDWQTDAASTVQSTLGRSNFFGTYLVLVIPLTLVRWRLAGRQVLSSRMVHAAYGLLLAGQLACLGLTLARGAWIGFAAAAVIFGIGFLFLSGKRGLAYLGIGVAGLMIVCALVLRPPMSDSEVTAQPPEASRAAALAEFDHGSTAARLTVWRFTLPLITERPWLGYGPETFHEVFVEVFPPQLVYYHGRDVKVDRAHNLWLDLAMSIGVVGVGALVLLLAGFAAVAWTGLRSAGNARHQLLWIGLCAALGGFLVDQQFSFSPIDSSVVFWLLLGLGAALGGGLKPTAQPGPEADSGSGARTFGIAVVSAVMISVVCIRPLLADTLAWHARQAGTSVEERITLARDAIRLESREPAYRVHLSWLYLASGEFDPAEREILAARRLSPNDPRILSAVGELYALGGLRDAHKLALAERAYRRTLDLAPHVAIYHTALGLVLARQGRLEEAIVAVERAVDLDATDGVAYAHLADLYDAAGRGEDARRARREARRLGVLVPMSPR